MSKNTVLFVDDEPNVLSSLQRGVIDEEYKAIFVDSAKKALEIMEQQEISVIVTDMKMPVMNGLELLKLVKEAYPDTVRVVLSGYTQLPQLLATINQGDIYKFIPKPWKLDEEFRPIINEALSHYNTLKTNRQHLAELENNNQLLQEKIADVQKKNTVYRDEILKIKLISLYFINSVKEKLQAASQTDEGILVHDIDFKIQLYMDFLNNVSSTNSPFSLNQLIDGVDKQVTNKYGENRLDITADSDINVLGNFGLIKFLLYFLYRISSNINLNGAKIPLRITVEQKDKKAVLTILTKISLEVGQDTTVEKTDLPSSLTEINEQVALLNRIARILNGQVSLHQLDRNIYLKAHLELQVDDSEK